MTTPARTGGLRGINRLSRRRHCDEADPLAFLLCTTPHITMVPVHVPTLATRV